MMGALGIPELVVIVLILSVWLIPIAAAIWVIRTLKRIRADQETIAAKLSELGRAERS